MKYFLLAVSALILPGSALAAPAPSAFFGGQSTFVASSSPGNAYAAGASVTVTGTTGADLAVAGGSITIASPVVGDALLTGGAVALRARVSGDARLAGGTVDITAPVDGDLLAVGAHVSNTAAVGKSVFIAAANATLASGAKGPVTIYANNVALGGTFDSDVRVIASGRVSLAENTIIRGGFSYESPEEARIPESAQILGGVAYQGAQYLPVHTQARALVVAGFGVFLFIRILAAVILAGLLAGLFPHFAQAVSARAARIRLGSAVLTGLLGFGVLVATPVLLILLALTFAGIAIAILLGIAYALMLILAFAFAGILVGSMIARRLEHRETVLWRDGAVGMLVISLIALIPIIGNSILFLFTMYALGALSILFFRFAFPKNPETEHLL